MRMLVFIEVPEPTDERPRTEIVVSADGVPVRNLAMVVLGPQPDFIEQGFSVLSEPR